MRSQKFRIDFSIRITRYHDLTHACTINIPLRLGVVTAPHQINSRLQRLFEQDSEAGMCNFQPLIEESCFIGVLMAPSLTVWHGGFLALIQSNHKPSPLCPQSSLTPRV